MVYDGDGNTTTLADEVNVFDSAGRHASTTTTGGTYQKYVRDGQDRIVQRDAHATSTTTARLGYTGPGDSSDLVLSTANKITQRELALPRGVIESLPVGGSAPWSYPNVHGDVVAIAGTAGTRTGTYRYDPFGQPVDTSTGTGVIGSTTADDTVADNLPNNSDYSWVGANQKLYEHTGTLAFIEMGARVYLPALGRFLTTDPIPGGNDNTYTYPNDPTNAFDLTGQKSNPHPKVHTQGWINPGLKRWWNSNTVGLCSQVSVGAVFMGAFSGCVGHSGRHWGVWGSGGFSGAAGPSLSGGVGLLFSNARNLDQLRGGFYGAGGSLGAGVGGAEEVSWGWYGNRRVFESLTSFIVGASAEVHVGYSWTGAHEF